MEVVVLTTGDSPVTVICCTTSPTSSVKLTTASSPTVKSNSRANGGLEACLFGADFLRSQGQGRDTIVSASPVVMLRVAPVSRLFTVTVAPPTPAPLGSQNLAGNGGGYLRAHRRNARREDKTTAIKND